MRALYLTLGIVLGGLFTVSLTTNILNYLTIEWQKENDAVYMTGYSDGWERCRLHITKQLEQQMLHTINEIIIRKRSK